MPEPQGTRAAQPVSLTRAPLRRRFALLSHHRRPIADARSLRTNTDSVKYGHVVYTNSTLTHQLCLGSTATGTSMINDTQLVLHECDYSFHRAAHSGQYWQ